MIKYLKAETQESVGLKVNGEVKIVVGDLARIGQKEFKKVEFVKGLNYIVKTPQPADVV